MGDISVLIHTMSGMYSKVIDLNQKKTVTIQNL